MTADFIKTDAHAILKSLFSPAFGEERARQLASRLLDAYGTLSRIKTASLSLLESDIGKEAALYLKLCLSLAIRRTADRLKKGDAVTEAILFRHFQALYADAGQETVYVTLLDGEDRLIAIHLASVGAADGSALLPRQVLELALRASARTVILTHNHPGGDPSFSATDIKTTRAVQAALNSAHVSLRAHYVFAQSTFARIAEDEDGQTISKTTERR